jgi:3-oxoadipate enol-lactonase
MGVVPLEGGAIGIVELGADGDSLPILFLHGVGSTKLVWQPQLAHFAATRRAIALDYPGYGESDPRPDHDHDGFARAMLEAMDALRVDRAHVCGLSLGGVVAIALHHLAPRRCASLILADSFACHPEGKGIHQRSVAASQSMGMRALAEARAPTLLGTEASDRLREEIIATMAGIDAAAYCQGAAAVWLADQRGRAAEIDCPTLVLVGDEDRITPPALSEELVRLIPGSTLEIIVGAGHLANIEQPATFNRAVDVFLSKNEEVS